MDLQDIHNILRFYIDKFKMGWYTPSELDTIIDRAQVEKMRRSYPLYAIDQQVQDSLTPFKREQLFTNISSPAGLITFNADYLHLIAVETVIMDGSVVLYVPVEIMNEAQISERRSSQLIPISVKSPVALLKQSGTTKKVQVYPASATAGTVYYICRPQIPQFVYTRNGRQVVYDDVLSTQILWNETDTEDIIFMACGLLGINLQDPGMIQIAELKTRTAA